jgi:hypothetical protein
VTTLRDRNRLAYEFRPNRKYKTTKERNRAKRERRAQRGKR